MKSNYQGITAEKWEDIVKAVKESKRKTNQSEDVLYEGVEQRGNRKHFYCYDNYDRYESPGLDFVLHGDSNEGVLYVYNSSEMARAPITLDQGLKIAKNFFNYEGSMMAEDIVCDYVMDNEGKGAKLSGLA